MIGPSIDRRGQQRGFAGQRKTDAFQADNGRDRHKSVSVDEMLKKLHTGPTTALRSVTHVQLNASILPALTGRKTH